MSNNDTQATWHYHDGTKHPNGTLFDWSQPYNNTVRPLLFKVYTDLAPTLLPLDRTPRNVSALDAIAVSSAVANPWIWKRWRVSSTSRPASRSI